MVAAGESPLVAIGGAGTSPLLLSLLFTARERIDNRRVLRALAEGAWFAITTLSGWIFLLLRPARLG